MCFPLFSWPSYVHNCMCILSLSRRPSFCVSKTSLDFGWSVKFSQGVVDWRQVVDPRFCDIGFSCTRLLHLHYCTWTIAMSSVFFMSTECEHGKYTPVSCPRMAVIVKCSRRTSRGCGSAGEGIGNSFVRQGTTREWRETGGLTIPYWWFIGATTEHWTGRSRKRGAGEGGVQQCDNNWWIVLLCTRHAIVGSDGKLEVRLFPCPDVFSVSALFLFVAYFPLVILN